MKTSKLINEFAVKQFYFNLTFKVTKSIAFSFIKTFVLLTAYAEYD